MENLRPHSQNTPVQTKQYNPEKTFRTMEKTTKSIHQMESFLRSTTETPLQTPQQKDQPLDLS